MFSILKKEEESFSDIRMQLFPSIKMYNYGFREIKEETNQLIPFTQSKILVLIELILTIKKQRNFGVQNYRT